MQLQILVQYFRSQITRCQSPRIDIIILNSLCSILRRKMYLKFAWAEPFLPSVKVGFEELGKALEFLQLAEGTNLRPDIIRNPFPVIFCRIFREIVIRSAADKEKVPNVFRNFVLIFRQVRCDQKRVSQLVLFKQTPANILIKRLKTNDFEKEKVFKKMSQVWCLRRALQLVPLGRRISSICWFAFCRALWNRGGCTGTSGRRAQDLQWQNTKWSQASRPRGIPRERCEFHRPE